MKPNFFKTLLTCATSFCAFHALAQSYSIDWFKVSGGGGTGSGGVYSVSSTIGQLDAGTTMSGGGYSLVGGFWSLFAVQTPGAPLLSIRLTATNTVMVFWLSPSTGFSLQQNSNLSTTNWFTASGTVSDNGTNRFIIVNPPTGNLYYRLSKP
jgi:hypothetical protein